MTLRYKDLLIVHEIAPQAASSSGTANLYVDNTNHRLVLSNNGTDPTEVITRNDVFTTTTSGIVPAPGSSTGLFLKDDGTWAVAGVGNITGSGLATAVTYWLDGTTISGVDTFTFDGTLLTAPTALIQSDGAYLEVASFAANNSAAIIVTGSGDGSAFSYIDLDNNNGFFGDHSWGIVHRDPDHALLLTYDTIPANGEFIFTSSGTMGIGLTGGIPSSHLDIDGAITIHEMNSPDPAPSGMARFYLDIDSDSVKLSESNGVYRDIDGLSTDVLLAGQVFGGRF